MNPFVRALLSLRDSFVHPRYWAFVADFVKFRALLRGRPARLSLRWRHRYPSLSDRREATEFDAHYVYHPAWAARIVAQVQPGLHVDVGSTLHFCSMVSAFVPVEFYDIRPAILTLPGLSSRHGDLLALPFPDRSVESISCMHVIEHVGLGRYGDPLDPEGDLKAMIELRRVLRPGGTLLFVVPVGKPCIRFNSHRIYSYRQVLDEFNELTLRQFALVDDGGRFTLDAPPEHADAQEYGCGCWWFVR